MRILVCPLGSPGFSFPAIAVARALVARGHTVAFATAPWLAPLLGGQALPYLPDPEGAATFDTSRWHDPAAVALQARHLAHAAARFGPDALVTSTLCLGPLLLGETAGLPVTVIGLLTPLLPAEGARRREFQAALDACRARLGLGASASSGWSETCTCPAGCPSSWTHRA